MAQQRPNLPANIPQNLMPPLPATPPTVQDVGQTGLTLHRLRASRVILGNVTNAELGAWDEYHHTLLVTRGAQAAPAWFTQAFAQGGVANVAINHWFTQAFAQGGVANIAINQAVNQAITNACAPNGAIYNLVDISYQASRARAINAHAIRDVDQLCEFPNMQGVLPSTIRIIFPQNRRALRNLTLGGYNALLAHYNQQIYPVIQTARESVRVYLGVPPFIENNI